MVRLKVLEEHFILDLLLYFNSTMVRLKAEFFPTKKAGKIIFQFHYGTIKSNCFMGFKY